MTKTTRVLSSLLEGFCIYIVQMVVINHMWVLSTWIEASVISFNFNGYIWLQATILDSIGLIYINVSPVEIMEIFIGHSWTNSTLHALPFLGTPYIGSSLSGRLVACSQDQQGLRTHFLHMSPGTHQVIISPIEHTDA